MVDALPLKPFMLFQYLDNEITDNASMLMFVFWCVSASASTEINDKKNKNNTQLKKQNHACLP